MQAGRQAEAIGGGNGSVSPGDERKRHHHALVTPGMAVT